MHISGIDPRQWSLAKEGSCKKLKNNVQNVPEEAKAKRDGVINPWNNNF